MTLYKIITALFFLTLLSGCSANHYSDEEYKKAEEVALYHLEANYQQIDPVEIEHIGDANMGGIQVKGTANHVKFNLIISVDNNGDMEMTSMGRGHGFPEKKPECEEKFCD